MAYKLYEQQELPSIRDLIIIFLAGFGSSNSKPQLEPLVFAVLVFITLRILWLEWHNSVNRQQLVKWLYKAVPIALLASLLIFATPVRNIIAYGNPFYPVKIEIAGKVLNHTLPMYSQAPDNLAKAPRAQRWLNSIIGINSAEWSVSQNSSDPNRHRMGGFFGAYVLFHIFLLIYLVAENCDRKSGMAGIVVGVMSLIAANFPQSHELRYFIYWMIVLISLNLYLVTQYQNRLINPCHLGAICLIALVVVGVKTDFVYLQPHFNTIAKFKNQIIENRVMAQIKPGDKICIPRMYPYALLYSPWFHRELGYTYSVRSGIRDYCAESEKIL
ncbi:MAG: hypothetical protein HC764_02555 [Pleurocapsa sp. CRU_1_2]|nr:hypothetical protein [Pleurocapsa sp. CRU_1_2]